MKQYRVQITDKGLRDMEEIYDYISKQLLSPDAAIKQYNKIAAAIESLKFFPERIKIMESEIEYKFGLRQLQVGNYAVFFIIRENVVIVVRVLYGASDIGKRLLN